MRQHPLRARHVVLRATVVLGVLALPACASNTPDGSSPPNTAVSVVASFYPLVYIAERVGGDRVTVANLTPPGAEPHDLELSPDQLEQIDSAAVAVVLGEGFQPSAEKAAATRSGATVVALDTVTAATGPGATGADPHIWLDPTLLLPVVDAVEQALSRADAGSAPRFAANASALKADLTGLDTRMERGLADCRRRVVVTSHDAFARMAMRYRLTTEGIAGFSPDAEPSPGRLADLAALVRRTGTTTVFTEDLVSPAVAETLARESGVVVQVLHTLEGPPATGDYLSAMDDNLAKLRAALGCR